ncbi:MAG: hypothetical protein IEMM0006_1344 [bacterium]|nr:MAG: hypothetical protein IEMM0006_1344 [bacterium]
MNTGTLIFMVVVQSAVTIITIYLFVKVLKAPPNPSDSEDEE